ncbi:hypothetical protein [Streptomyces sporangiiformans]|uniref:DUF4386 family protein n=1 Tax=Streptomyces sporangiiformans TaxID=2315329 RepID=A0A505DQA3_9ACTN|nr:hypothetical protein [Streptomyces sporangiiformans]TPQ23468.1 hypothetical protein FGD71_004420 [Streptomyces sporangiiformans]
MPAAGSTRETHPAGSAGSELTIAGALMVVGFLINIVSTALHPSGEEDDHQAIFTEYADSDAWVAVHLGQFVGVLVALGGLLVLYRALRGTGRSALLAHLAAALTVATAAMWAVLQGLDGVGLKQAADAWAAASAADKQIRFADAETVRWLEWGFQSYFRILLGLAFALFGAALIAGRSVAGALGWAAVLAGIISVVIGVDVGYSGLASGLQDALGIAFFIVALIFAFGVLISGMRKHGRRSSREAP